MRSVALALFAVLCGCQPPPAPTGGNGNDSGSSGAGGPPTIHLLYPLPAEGEEAVHFTLVPVDDGNGNVVNHLQFDAVIWAENFTIVDPATDTEPPSLTRGHWHLRILDSNGDQQAYFAESTTAASADTDFFKDQKTTWQGSIAATLENSNHQPIKNADDSTCATCEEAVEATVDPPAL